MSVLTVSALPPRGGTFQRARARGAIGEAPVGRGFTERYSSRMSSRGTPCTHGCILDGIWSVARTLWHFAQARVSFPGSSPGLFATLPSTKVVRRSFALPTGSFLACRYASPERRRPREADVEANDHSSIRSSASAAGIARATRRLTRRPMPVQSPDDRWSGTQLKQTRLIERTMRRAAGSVGSSAYSGR